MQTSPPPETPTPLPPRRHRIRRSLGLLLLMLTAALGWLLGTSSGRDAALRQIAARLPEGITLEWNRAEGVLLGTLTLHEPHYAQELDTGTLTFSAKRLAVNLTWWRLLTGQIRLDSLVLEDATLDLPPAGDSAPFTLPQWPDLLPTITLPLPLGVDDILIEGLHVQQDGAPLLKIKRLGGGLLARSGQVEVQTLAIDSDRGQFWLDGVYQPGQHDGTHLVANTVLPGATSARFGLIVDGDLDAMTVKLVGNAPHTIVLHWSLRNGNEWTLAAHAEAFDPNLLSGDSPGTPIAFTLSATGSGGESQWQGRVQQGDISATLHPSTLRRDGQRLLLDPLQLDIATTAQTHGQIHASGHADFSPADGPRFALNLSGNHWQMGDPSIDLNATLALEGRFQDWQARGQATLRREQQQAQLDLHGQGNAERLRLDTLRVRMPGGHLEASGELGWAPALHWDVRGSLAGFDPGWFARDWPGAVTAQLSSRGHTAANGRLHLAVHAHDLGGQLRQRPLAGEAQFNLHTREHGLPAIEGEADLRLGQSRVTLAASTRPALNLSARLSPLHLADLWPEAEGTISGDLHLTGTLDAPNLATDLNARELRWGEQRLASFSARGHLPWREGEGALSVSASGIEAGIIVPQVQLNLAGTAQRPQLTLTASTPMVRLSTRASAQSRRGGQWQATIDHLHLTPRDGADWQLQTPMALTWRGPRWALSRGCLHSDNSAYLCAEADWPQTGLTLDARALPLLLLSPWLRTILPEHAPGEPWLLRGAVDVDAHLRPLAGRWQGRIGVTSPNGQLRTHAAAARDVIGYRNLQLALALEPDHLHASVSARLPDPTQAETAADASGNINAEITTGWEPHSALQGHLTFNMRDLTWLELFSADIASPSGQFSADVRLNGERNTPQFSGHARLHTLTAELPALAIDLHQGEITLAAEPGQPARLSGQAQSGEGTLTLTGSLDWRAPDWPLHLTLGGHNILASNTRDLHLVIDPELTLSTRARHPLSISGRIHVPSALLDLERLDSGVPVSPDVVILDPQTPGQATATGQQTILNLTVEMGKDVRLRGFGLDGRLGGQLHLSAQPGREMTGSGQLDVTGGYKAYGQALTITRAHLQFTNDGPLSDPLIDMSAERKIETEDMTAGITVTGRASAPDVSVWTNPATDSSQALAWLAFGRPLSTLTAPQSQQFNTAATALSAGGNLLAGQIGRRLGLDDAGLTTSRTLGESVLGIGKQISPRLYLGFGVSMIGNGQVLTLKYLLRKGFDVEIESSTLESRGSVNWRHESD